MSAAKAEKIFVFGARGHAKVVIDVIERQGGREISCLADDDPALKGTLVFSYAVVGGRAELARSAVKRGIVAIGDNAARWEVALALEEAGLSLAPAAVHPSAQLSRGVRIGAGSVVMAGAIVNADAMIGRNVIINTAASVDHDCSIGDGVHVAPGVTLCGGVSVGERSLLGAGSTIIPGIRVGAGVTVGAGAVVVKDLPDGATAVGVPARIVRAA